MGILDIFDKNLLEERKNHMEIPKEFITREFLNSFKDLNVRQQVYTRIVDTSLSYDECINWGRQNVTVNLIAYPGQW